MQLPLISIITRIYNRFDYLPQAVKCLYDQTYKNIEIVIVDDGSNTDLSRLLPKDHLEKVHSIKQEHGGRSRALNTGFKGCHGEFIIILDDDDVLDRTMIEKCVDALNKTNADMVTVGYRFFRSNSELSENSAFISTAASDPFARLLKDNVYAVGNSVMLRKELVEHAGFVDESLESCEDWDLWLRVTYLRPKVTSIEEGLSYQRIHSRNTCQNDALMQEGRLKVLLKLTHLLSKEEVLKFQIKRKMGIRYLIAGWYMNLAGDPEGKEWILRSFKECGILFVPALAIYLGALFPVSFLTKLTMLTEVLTNRRNLFRETAEFSENKQ